MRYRWPVRGWQLALVLTSLGLLLGGPQVHAAERVEFKYGLLRRSIAVSDLQTFAKTGVVSPELDTYLRASGQQPETVRRILTQPIPIDVLSLDRMLNHPVGGLVLDQVGQMVSTPTRQADRQALRSALIVSASQDDQITLLELLENYPTREVGIEGELLMKGFRRASNLITRAKDIYPYLDLATGLLRPILGD